MYRILYYIHYKGDEELFFFFAWEVILQGGVVEMVWLEVQLEVVGWMRIGLGS